MQMSVIFLCPFMDDSALPFIRATNFTWQETDLKRQPPLELCLGLTKSMLKCLHKQTCICYKGDGRFQPLYLCIIAQETVEKTSDSLAIQYMKAFTALNNSLFSNQGYMWFSMASSVFFLSRCVLYDVYMVCASVCSGGGRESYIFPDDDQLMAITFSVVMAEAALTAGRLGLFVLLRVSPSHPCKKMSHRFGSSAVVLI